MNLFAVTLNCSISLCSIIMSSNLVQGSFGVGKIHRYTFFNAFSPSVLLGQRAIYFLIKGSVGFSNS